jgi:hypothetical protein
MLRDTFISIRQCSYAFDPASWCTPVQKNEYKHSCNPACFSLYRPQHNSNIFICTLSGNIHVCGISKCATTCICKDGVVCTTTGQTLDMVMVSDPFDGRALRGGKRERVLEGEQAAESFDVVMTSTSPKQKQKHKTSPKARSNTSVVNSPKSALENQKIIASTIRVIMKDHCMLARNEALLAHFTSLCTAVIQLIWSKLPQTEHYKTDNSRYKIEYHTLVCLYAMQRGFEDEQRPENNRVLFPEHKCFDHILEEPSMIPARSNKALTESKFTHHEKFFKLCLITMDEVEYNLLARSVLIKLPFIIQACQLLSPPHRPLPPPPP